MKDCFVVWYYNVLFLCGVGFFCNEFVVIIRELEERLYCKMVVEVCVGIGCSIICYVFY